MKGHCRIGRDAIGLAMGGAMSGEESQALLAERQAVPGALDMLAEPLRQAPLTFLSIAREIALSHHERWDGTGYPDGLAGESIPIPARLMAVADGLDALISRRVYKPPMPFDQAAQIIREGRGSHFDPLVVDAFLSRRAEFQAIAERYADSEAAIQAKRAAVQGRAPARKQTRTA